ncbi:alpha/beta fold hydrolase [Micromonospora sp. NPDC092111]|uniref:alpha/beta fold hydrolase n=1 Tax=Micromonospora sp. NPDC092111 TaxID=3364289 RepID=UPI0038302740
MTGPDRRPVAAGSPGSGPLGPPGGGPSVLLCAGMGDRAATWDPLAPLLAAAGFRVARLGREGRPDVGRVPTLAGEVARIGASVAVLGRPVLVAHSAAALPAEAYARLRPGRLAGLVLVDPSVVESVAWGRLSRWAGRPVVSAGPVLAGFLDRSGLAGRLGPWAWTRAVRRMSVRPPDPALAAWYGSGAVLARVLVEWSTYPAMAAELVAVRAATAPPVLPVRVLTALGDVDRPVARAAWRRGHARLAEGFPAGRQEVFRDARHLLHRDHPEVVAATVAVLDRDSGL